MSDSPEPSRDGQREIPFAVALVPVAALIGFLATAILLLPRVYDGFEGSGHIPLILAAAVAGLVARAYGHRWKSIERGIVEAIRMAMGAILILLTIGMLMGTWLASGVVPALVDWGLLLLHPSYFLPAACAVCSVVSLVSGSSWSTAGTVGLALIGVGNAMGIDPAMTAGAVVSGAYFGDKLSPMSDTTNLAPAMAGTDLFTHIRHMSLTTGPAWVIAMIGYTALGLTIEPSQTAGSMDEIRQLIERTFDPGVMQLLPPVIVVGLVLARQPALPSLLLGVALGGVVALLTQEATLATVLDAALNGYTSSTGNAAVDELLSRGGMLSMASTVFLILSAMAFGGIMEHSGMLRTIAVRLLKLARSTGSLIATTVLTSLGMNIVAADQYISIVVPGRMYVDAYQQRGLHPKNLSRALEDGGTITSPLVPWNTCGAFMSATLMVATASYLPYAFLNLLNPIISMFYGFTGLTITPLEQDETSAAPVVGGAA